LTGGDVVKNKLIVFDFFGVMGSEVADLWLPKHFSAEESERLHRGIISDADAGRIDPELMYDELSRLSGVDKNTLKREWRELAKVDTEMVELVRELRKEYTVVLLSNAYNEFIDDIFEKYSMDDCFERRFISSELKMIKPDPAIFRHVLSEMGYSAKDSVMIDDNPRNISAAKAVGMKGIVFCGRESLVNELSDIFNT
jgi:HAD superfamily hydrolase (TIGR01509 family)